MIKGIWNRWALGKNSEKRSRRKQYLILEHLGIRQVNTEEGTFQAEKIALEGMLGGKQVVSLMGNNPALSLGPIPSGSVLSSPVQLSSSLGPLPWPFYPAHSGSLGSGRGSGDGKAPLQIAHLTWWRSKSFIPSEWCQRQCQQHRRHKPMSHFSEGTHGACPQEWPSAYCCFPTPFQRAQVQRSRTNGKDGVW